MVDKSKRRTGTPSGKASKRKADQLAYSSRTEALKAARKAKERGNLRKSRQIMRNYRQNN